MDIFLWNQSPKELEDSVGELIAEACDRQMREDVAPAYGWQRAPTVTFCPSNTQLEDLPKDCLVVMFAEDSSHAQAVTGLPPEAPPPAGSMPAPATTRVRDGGRRNFARVYPGIIRRNDGNILTGEHSISAATSHECIEATYDPNVALWVWNENDRKLVAGEVCDQVEDDAYTKTVRGQDVAVSNFVYPAWFDIRAHDCQFDQMGKLNAPFTCSPGGYFIFYDPAIARDPAKPGDGFQVQTEPPGQAVQWGWAAKIKREGFARTRVRLVWGPAA